MGQYLVKLSLKYIEKIEDTEYFYVKFFKISCQK